MFALFCHQGTILICVILYRFVINSVVNRLIFQRRGLNRNKYHFKFLCTHHCLFFFFKKRAPCNLNPLNVHLRQTLIRLSTDVRIKYSKKISYNNFIDKSHRCSHIQCEFYFIGRMINKDITIRIRLLYSAHADNVF